MRFDHESWRKLYRHEPLDQRAWPLIWRALRDYLLRYPEELDGVLLKIPKPPQNGTLELPGTGMGHEWDIRGTGVEMLCDALHSHAEERDLVVRALKGLFEDTYLVIDKDRIVRIRNFEQAQRSKDAKRKAKSRYSKAADKSGTRVGQEWDKSGTTADKSVTLARARAIDLDQKRFRSDQTSTTSVACARECARVRSRDDDDDINILEETECPVNLTEDALRLGIPREFAQFYKTTDDAVIEQIHEFVAYWTIGGGKGRLRTNWLIHLRQRLKDIGEQQKFNPPGLLEHQLIKHQENLAPLHKIINGNTLKSNAR